LFSDANSPALNSLMSMCCLRVDKLSDENVLLDWVAAAHAFALGRNLKQLACMLARAASNIHMHKTKRRTQKLLAHVAR